MCFVGARLGPGLAGVCHPSRGLANLATCCLIWPVSGTSEPTRVRPEEAEIDGWIAGWLDGQRKRKRVSWLQVSIDARLMIVWFRSPGLASKFC